MRHIKFVFTMLLVLAVSGVWAQLDRSKAPISTEAPQFEMSTPKSFTLKNGLKVIVMENHKSPQVNFRIFVDRGPIFEDSVAGISEMVGGVLMAGTSTRTKDVLAEEIDFIGANVYATATGITGSCLTKHQEKVLTLMQDVLLHPSFPSEELDLLKKQFLSGLSSGKSDAKSIGNNVRSMMLFGEKHPYGELATEQTIERVSIDAIKNYYKKYMRPNISYLVIVGDIDFKTAKKLSEKYFSAWEKQEVKKVNQPAVPEIKNNMVAISHKPGAVQTYLNFTHTINLQPGAKDIFAVKLLQSILGGGSDGRLFKNIRESKGYTYGAYCNFASDQVMGSFSGTAEVRNEVTDSAATEFIYEFNRIRTEKVTDEVLALHKAKFIGGFARGLENTATFAQHALDIERYGLPANFYATYLDNINKVTTDDILAAAKKYLHPENLYIIAVGDRDLLKDKMQKFSTSPVKEYDYYGKEVKASEISIPEGLTAQAVIDTYLKAVKSDTWKSVQDITVKGLVDVGQMKLQITVFTKDRKKSKMSLAMGPMVVQEQIYDGEKGFVKGAQGSGPLPKEQMLDLRLQAALLEELLYSELNITPELKKVERVGDKDCYVVEVNLPNKKLVYFDIKSGLKVKDESSMETPQGAFAVVNEYSDYREVGGGLMPFVVHRQEGPQQIVMTIQEADVTTKIDPAIFELK